MLLRKIDQRSPAGTGGGIETIPVSSIRPDIPVFFIQQCQHRAGELHQVGLMAWKQYGENQLQAELGKPRAEAGITNHI